MVKVLQASDFRQALSRAYRRLVLVAVLLACTSLLACGGVVMRENLNRDLGVFANLAGAWAEPALIAGDGRALRERLAAFTGDSLVERFEIVDKAGAPVILWERPGQGPWYALERRVSRVFWPTPVVRPISQGDQRSGEVRVYGSAAGILRFLGIGLVMAVLCFAATLVATGLLARRMWLRVTQPLRHVAETARSVRVERAFHRRIPQPGVVEVDNLVHDFNKLLVELQGFQSGTAQENQELVWAATHDALTGLGNRFAFERHVEATIHHASCEAMQFAVLYLDADRFKKVNDTYGHDAGDTVLQAVACRVEQCIRQADKAFRVGGDEFAIILAPPTGVEDVEAIIARINNGMVPTIVLPDGRAVTMTVSIGYAGYPQDAVARDELVRLADRDMYRNKARLYEEQIANSR